LSYGRAMRRGRRPSWQAASAAAILALAAWLRLRHLGLAEYDDDQAIALRIGHDILHGNVRTVGLASSSGASNPPLYVYIVAFVVLVHDGLIFATVTTAVLAVVAVALTFVVVRRRFGAPVALTTTALFATAPWAVLYGRHLWQQDYLPVVTVSLLWSLFAVLERSRTRVALLVPVLFVVSIQLNLSAVALILPIAAVLAYRGRDVDWRAVVGGCTAGVVLLGPWLAHNAKHGFRDFSLIADNGRGHGGAAGTGTIEAIRQVVDLLSAEGWTFVTGEQHGGGAAWTLGRAAGVVVIVLLCIGIVTTVARVVRAGGRLGVDTARRALLVAWLVGICLAYVTSSRNGVGPHYLIISYPVSFLLAALGLDDAASVLGRRSAVASLGVAAAIGGAFVAFTLSFQAFVQRNGGTAGNYDVVYDDASALAAAVHARRLHVDRASVEYLVSGHLNIPDGVPQNDVVTVRDRFRDHSPLPCSGQIRRFGKLEACFPP